MRSTNDQYIVRLCVLCTKGPQKASELCLRQWEVSRSNFSVAWFVESPLKVWFKTTILSSQASVLCREYNITPILLCETKLWYFKSVLMVGKFQHWRID